MIDGRQSNSSEIEAGKELQKKLLCVWTEAHLFEQELGGHEGLIDCEDGQVVIATPARPREHFHPVALLHHQPCTAFIAQSTPHSCACHDADRSRGTASESHRIEAGKEVCNTVLAPASVSHTGSYSELWATRKAQLQPRPAVS